MVRLFSGVLCGKWFSQCFRFPTGSLECSPICSLYSSSSLLRFLGQMAVALEKVAWRVPQLC